MKPLNPNCSLKLTIVEASFLKDADFFGKQDPLIKFQHRGREFRTTTAEDAGKHAVWNEVFPLEDLDPNGHLVLAAYDEDPTGLDWLGQIKPVATQDLIKDQKERQHNLDLFDKKDKKAGNVIFKTQYTWAEPDPPLAKRDPQLKPLNKKCTLEIKIVDATFLKDADLVGKQDPYIKFAYGRGTFETTVKDDAGKYALWNETFTLGNIAAQVQAGGSLVLEAFEKDLASSDFLGRIKPITFQSLADFEGAMKHNVEIFDEKKQKAGSMRFSTLLHWVDYVPPPPCELLDKRSMLRIVIKSATFLKDADTFGKQDPYIKFKYEGKALQTDVKDDAGKSAVWDETFQLPNIKQQVSNSIVFEAYDKDLLSSDLLGVTDPLDFIDYLADDRVHELDLELFEPKGAKAGNVKLSTQLILVQPDPPVNPRLNYNCQLEIKIREATFLKDSDAFGKQDPYLQFQYDGRDLKTEVQDDAGLKANFDDVFLLENLEPELQNPLIMCAYDKDLASSDLLGKANPLSFVSLIRDEQEHQHDLDLFHEYKKTGNVKFSTRFVWCEPDPPANPKLNSKCRLLLVIKQAQFLKDADTFGKQDPYIRFLYNGKKVETEVKDDAGLQAEWNEKFCLTEVESQVHSGKRLVFEAFDKDLASSDFLGKSKGISFVTLVETEDLKTHTLLLSDEDGKKAGELIVTSQFVYVPPDPECNFDLNRNCILKVWIHNAKFFKDHDTFGKQDPFVKFIYDEQELKTKVVDDGGKEASWEEEFQLKNVYQQVRLEESLVLEAHDKDPVGSDVIGVAQPLSFNALTQSEQLTPHALDLFLNYKHAGSLNISTQLEWFESDPIPQNLNSKCYLILTILEGDWFKDADLIGKQDPYVQWKYGKNVMKTTTKDEAGKHAEWNEEFELKNIREQILNGEEMILQTYDEDVVLHDFLGASRPIPWQDFCHNEEPQVMTVDLFDKKKKKTGTIKFQTQYKYVQIKVLPKVNHTAYTALWKGTASTLDYQTEGNLAKLEYKIQHHQKVQMEARLTKLIKEEEKAKKRINDTKRQVEFLATIKEQKEKNEMLKTQHLRDVKAAEEQARLKFNLERQNHKNQMDNARYSIFASNKQNSQAVKSEAKKIKEMIVTNRKEMINEKQGNFIKIRTEKEKGRVSKAIKMSIKSTYGQKLQEVGNRTSQIAQDRKLLEQKEQEFLKRLQDTYQQEKKVHEALANMRATSSRLPPMSKTMGSSSGFFSKTERNKSTHTES